MATELPNHRELSPSFLGFLDQHLTPFSCSDMTAVRDLATGLSQECAELDAHLIHRHQSLSKLLISWISRSIASKTALRQLNLSTRSNATTTSPCGFGSLRIHKMLNEDLPQLVTELKQLENIRCYLNTALQLEAMIGDLEDAVFSVMRQRTGNDYKTTQENLFQAVRFMNDIEDVLVNPLKFKGQWCHLLKSVDSRVEKTLTLLRPQVLAGHRALLSSLGWPPKVLMSKMESGKIASLPNPLVLMQADKQKAYSESFLALCALQHLQTRREERQIGLSGVKNQNAGIWAIDELVYPIASRMEYHFSKWTDQPEFIFALVYKVTKDFMVGVDDTLQPLVDRAKLGGFSVKEAWVSEMAQMLSAFLAKRFFSVLSERRKEKETRSEVISQWLHLVDLMVKFDKQVLSIVSSDAYLFVGDSERCEESSRSFSVFSLFSDRPDWLKIWVKAELKDCKMKLKEELKHEKAWLVGIKQGVGSVVDRARENFVLYTREDYNAPLIVESALNLSWEMIERCKTLPGIFTRIKFIRSTSDRVIWYFLKLLLSRYKSIEYLVADCDNDSLVTLCGLINAAKYCEIKLQEWSDGVNFLEMAIAERDRKVCLKDDANENCSFFEEEIKSLADLEMNWLMEIISGHLHQFEILTLDYIHNKLQFEQEDEENYLLRTSEPTGISASMNFVEALDALRSRLYRIDASLNPKDFSDLWRSLADGLDRFIFGSIFMKDYRFSEKGTKQFAADMQALFLVFKPFCARPEAFFPCIRDSLKLLVIDRRDFGRLVVVSSNALDRKESLRCFGIAHLSFDEAERILRNRKF